MQLSGKKHTPAVCTLFTSLWCGARPKLSGSLIAKVSTCIKASLAGFSAPVYPGIANMKVENIEILHQPYALWLNKEIFREDFCEIAADQQVIIHSWGNLSHSSVNLLREYGMTGNVESYPFVRPFHWNQTEPTQALEINTQGTDSH